MKYNKGVFLSIILGLSFIIMVSFNAFKPISVQEIKWISFEDAVELQKTKPKKIIVDVYTDWCGWCKKMDKNTYTDAEVIKQIEANFYFVKLDAEQKEEIKYKDKVFSFKQEYKANELAVSLLNGQMSYPSTVFLDEDMNLLTVVPGYLTPKDMNPILKYFGENIYKEKNWKEYSGQ
jgi:thioredoxin-related protein